MSSIKSVSFSLHFPTAVSSFAASPGVKDSAQNLLCQVWRNQEVTVTSVQTHPGPEAITVSDSYFWGISSPPSCAFGWWGFFIFSFPVLFSITSSSFNPHSTSLSLSSFLPLDLFVFFFLTFLNVSFSRFLSFPSPHHLNYFTAVLYLFCRVYYCLAVEETWYTFSPFSPFLKLLF